MLGRQDDLSSEDQAVYILLTYMFVEEAKNPVAVVAGMEAIHGPNGFIFI
jgi:hypothetical protein